MNSYDFSQIDFSDSEMAAGLATVYAILLERAERRKQELSQQGNTVLSAVSSTQESIEEMATAHTIPIAYVQEQMFLEEVCDG